MSKGNTRDVFAIKDMVGMTGAFSRVEVVGSRSHHRHHLRGFSWPYANMTSWNFCTHPVGRCYYSIL